jgi:Uri superfamily endonuclease
MKTPVIPTYETRITRQLPPISMAQIDYLMQKYRQQLWQVVAVVNDPFESKYLEMDELWFEMLGDLYWDKERYKIKNIESFEKWMIDYVREKIDEEYVYKVGTAIEKEIVGGRIYRSRIFDQFSQKYFTVFMEKLANAGISNPVEIIRTAFDNAENWHIDFEEDEECFVSGLISILTIYCNALQRPDITKAYLETGLEIS